MHKHVYNQTSTRDKSGLVINQVPGANGEGLGSTLKLFLSYTYGTRSSQEMFDLTASKPATTVEGRERVLL